MNLTDCFIRLETCVDTYARQEKDALITQTRHSLTEYCEQLPKRKRASLLATYENNLHKEGAPAAEAVTSPSRDCWKVVAREIGKRIREEKPDLSVDKIAIKVNKECVCV